MAVVFCTPFDADFDSCNADVGDDDGSPASIDTSVKKFGAGSLKGSNFLRMIYDPYTYDSSNEGAIGVWAYATVGKGLSYANEIVKSLFDNSSKIRWDYIIDNNIAGGLPGYKSTIQMWDSGGTRRVNATVTTAFAFTTGFYYFELNWKWNDAGGKTEVFFNGNSIISDTGGNSFSRDGSQITRLDHQHGGQSPVYVDDFTVWDARQHTSGFSPPVSPSCVCGAVAPKRPLTLGAYFGMNSMGR